MSRPRLATVAVAVVLAGCAVPEEPVSPDFAKAASGPSVAATDPSFAHRGDQGVAVTITGSGFDAGSQASWQRNGATDPKITVRSTRYVSSTQLVATIDVATDAALSLYDVAVTTSTGRKGIGTARFEVTQAELVAGTEFMRGANEAGELAGRSGPPGAVYFSPVTGLDTLGAPGSANDLSEDGLTVVGFTGVCCDGAFVFENIDGSWQYTVLPRDPAAGSHGARAVGSGGGGAAVYIGGFDFYSKKGTNFVRRPIIWSDSAGNWVRNPLPAPAGSDGLVYDVNGTGTAVGMVDNVATVWTESGPRSWTSAAIGGAGSQAWAISAAGSTIVGYVTSGKGRAAQYWTFSGGAWTANALPGGCTEAVDIDSGGRILANDCPNGNRKTPAVISPPYESGDVRLLGALGDANGVTTASRMSANGTWIAGSAPYKSVSVGVRWTLGSP